MHRRATCGSVSCPRILWHADWSSRGIRPPTFPLVADLSTSRATVTPEKRMRIMYFSWCFGIMPYRLRLASKVIIQKWHNKHHACIFFLFLHKSLLHPHVNSFSIFRNPSPERLAIRIAKLCLENCYSRDGFSKLNSQWSSDHPGHNLITQCNSISLRSPIFTHVIILCLCGPLADFPTCRNIGLGESLLLVKGH